MTNERMVDLHVEHNEGFAYSPWMLSADSSESVDIREMEEAPLVTQESLTEKQTTN